MFILGDYPNWIIIVDIKALIGKHQANFAMTIGRTEGDKITVGNCGKSLLVIPHSESCAYLIPKHRLGRKNDKNISDDLGTIALDLSKYQDCIVDRVNN